MREKVMGKGSEGGGEQICAVNSGPKSHAALEPSFKSFQSMPLLLMVNLRTQSAKSLSKKSYLVAAFLANNQPGSKGFQSNLLVASCRWFYKLSAVCYSEHPFLKSCC